MLGVQGCSRCGVVGRIYSNFGLVFIINQMDFNKTRRVLTFLYSQKMENDGYWWKNWYRYSEILRPSYALLTLNVIQQIPSQIDSKCEKQPCNGLRQFKKSKCQKNDPSISQGVSTNHKSSNRIKLPELYQDYLYFYTNLT